MLFQCQYPRAALTVDCVVFGVEEAGLKLLLISLKEKYQEGARRPAQFFRFVHAKYERLKK